MPDERSAYLSFLKHLGDALPGVTLYDFGHVPLDHAGDQWVAVQILGGRLSKLRRFEVRLHCVVKGEQSGGLKDQVIGALESLQKIRRIDITGYLQVRSITERPSVPAAQGITSTPIDVLILIRTCLE